MIEVKLPYFTVRGGRGQEFKGRGIKLDRWMVLLTIHDDAGGYEEWLIGVKNQQEMTKEMMGILLVLNKDLPTENT